MTARKDLVWYLGYGSNLLKERFLCYIVGGKPTGSNKTHDGCRDKTPPIMDKPGIIRNELYFSKNSKPWKDGGVAFVATEKDDNIQTFGRLYLITRQQFEDVAKDETSSTYIQKVNFAEAIEKGNTIFKSPSWYGNVLYLGDDTNYPIFTLTNEVTLPDITKPDATYIVTIAKGLKETHGLSNAELIEYFMDKKGIEANYTIDELTSIIRSIE